MCAINGFTFRDRELILKMNAVTQHRGPDDTGVFLDARVSLGHNRLSIIDLSKRAHQPMASDDRGLVIVFNGEIYNFETLKRELSDSYRFTTKSDTEVILAAYKTWGHTCVARFNGIFAFAIWDARKRELFLARDHSGVKPLYYTYKKDQLIFSSEIKGILEHDIPRVLDRGAFNNYFRILYTPQPDTLFEGVKKLPPASYGVFKNGILTTHSYWNPSRAVVKRGYEEEKKELREHIQASVSAQLISDRPLGVYLSGGFDSSAVLHSMAHVRRSIDTFSVGFSLGEGEEADKYNADFNLARKTAAFYGTNHHELVVRPEDVAEHFENAVYHMDEPISNPTAIAMKLLAAFTKKEVAIALGGDGGDELFGGYERYQLSRVASLYQQFTPAVLRGMFRFHDRLVKLNTPPGVERFALFMFQKDNILNEVLSPKVFDAPYTPDFFHEQFFKRRETKNFETLFMNVDRQSWLTDYFLTLSDKMSMANGLEVRVPLLAPDLIEFAQTIPLRRKVTPWRTKKILKDAYRGHLPDYLYSEPKRGWFSPAAKWLRYKDMYALAEEVLSPSYYEGTRRLFNWEAIVRILEDHRDKKRYNLVIIWALMTFQVWARKYSIIDARD